METSNTEECELCKHTFTFEPACRICHSGAEESGQPLITPCLCTGSLEFVHQECLSNWIQRSNAKKCEQCKHNFNLGHKMRPISQWEEKADMMVATIFCNILSICLLAMTGSMGWLIWLIRNEPRGATFTTIMLVVPLLVGVGVLFALWAGCIGFFRKWRLSNSRIVVREISHV